LRPILGPVLLAVLAAARPPASGADPGTGADVARVISPLMKQWGIPGMAIGLAREGRTQVFTFGVTCLETGQPVSPETLFEIGSVTKTFTATLAAYAEEKGALSLADPVARFLPELRGTPFGAVPLVHLGTHTPGGLPLQVPASVTSLEQMFTFFKAWKPASAPGTLRTYSNPGVGALGLCAARSLGREVGPLLEEDLLPALGLHHSYLHVPAAQQGHYAQGYTTEGRPVRLTAGVFWEQTYGIKTTAGDLLIYLEENLGLLTVDDPRLARGLLATHTGYIRSGPLTQDLIWEQYAMPVSLEALLQGNSAEMLSTARPATALSPPLAPHPKVWINKTGSTSGFGAYVAFIPSERLGIVLLANKSYPIPDRVRAAYSILAQVHPAH
jgi:beta-lactamase class C